MGNKKKKNKSKNNKNSETKKIDINKVNEKINESEVDSELDNPYKSNIGVDDETKVLDLNQEDFKTPDEDLEVKPVEVKVSDETITIKTLKQFSPRYVLIIEVIWAPLLRTESMPAK